MEWEQELDNLIEFMGGLIDEMNNWLGTGRLRSVFFSVVNPIEYGDETAFIELWKFLKMSRYTHTPPIFLILQFLEHVKGTPLLLVAKADT